jgi:CrcB protein
VSPLAWVAFVAAGALGAPARYLLDLAVQDRTGGGYPGGTVVINISGSLLLGLLTGLALHHGLSQTAKVVLGTGFCGAYTTFSTFSLETVRLIEEGALPEAIRNSLGTVAFGTAAAAAGLILGTL